MFIAYFKEQPNKRMQSDFGELALASAADARRYVASTERSTREVRLFYKSLLQAQSRLK